MEFQKSTPKTRSLKRTKVENETSPIFNIHVHIPPEEGNNSPSTPRQSIIHLHFDGLAKYVASVEGNSSGRTSDENSLQNLLSLVTPEPGKTKDIHGNSGSEVLQSKYTNASLEDDLCKMRKSLKIDDSVVSFQLHGNEITRISNNSSVKENEANNSKVNLIFAREDRKISNDHHTEKFSKLYSKQSSSSKINSTYKVKNDISQLPSQNHCHLRKALVLSDDPGFENHQITADCRSTKQNENSRNSICSDNNNSVIDTDEDSVRNLLSNLFEDNVHNTSDIEQSSLGEESEEAFKNRVKKSIYLLKRKLANQKLIHKAESDKTLSENSKNVSKESLIERFVKSLINSSVGNCDSAVVNTKNDANSIFQINNKLVKGKDKHTEGGLQSGKNSSNKKETQQAESKLLCIEPPKKKRGRPRKIISDDTSKKEIEKVKSNKELTLNIATGKNKRDKLGKSLIDEDLSKEIYEIVDNKGKNSDRNVLNDSKSELGDVKKRNLTKAEENSDTVSQPVPGQTSESEDSEIIIKKKNLRASSKDSSFTDFFSDSDFKKQEKKVFKKGKPKRKKKGDPRQSEESELSDKVIHDIEVEYMKETKLELKDSIENSVEKKYETERSLEENKLLNKLLKDNENIKGNAKLEKVSNHTDKNSLGESRTEENGDNRNNKVDKKTSPTKKEGRVKASPKNVKEILNVTTENSSDECKNEAKGMNGKEKKKSKNEKVKKREKLILTPKFVQGVSDESDDPEDFIRKIQNEILEKVQKSSTTLRPKTQSKKKQMKKSNTFGDIATERNSSKILEKKLPKDKELNKQENYTVEDREPKSEEVEIQKNSRMDVYNNESELNTEIDNQAYTAAEKSCGYTNTGRDLSFGDDLSPDCIPDTQIDKVGIPLKNPLKDIGIEKAPEVSHSADKKSTEVEVLLGELKDGITSKVDKIKKERDCTADQNENLTVKDRSSDLEKRTESTNSSKRPNDSFSSPGAEIEHCNDDVVNRIKPGSDTEKEKTVNSEINIKKNHLNDSNGKSSLEVEEIRKILEGCEEGLMSDMDTQLEEYHSDSNEEASEDNSKNILNSLGRNSKVKRNFVNNVLQKRKVGKEKEIKKTGREKVEIQVYSITKDCSVKNNGTDMASEEIINKENFVTKEPVFIDNTNKANHKAQGCNSNEIDSGDELLGTQENAAIDALNKKKPEIDNITNQKNTRKKVSCNGNSSDEVCKSNRTADFFRNEVKTPKIEEAKISNFDIDIQRCSEGSPKQSADNLVFVESSSEVEEFDVEKQCGEETRKRRGSEDGDTSSTEYLEQEKVKVINQAGILISVSEEDFSEESETDDDAETREKSKFSSISEEKVVIKDKNWSTMFNSKSTMSEKSVLLLEKNVNKELKKVEDKKQGKINNLRKQPPDEVLSALADPEKTLSGLAHSPVINESKEIHDTLEHYERKPVKYKHNSLGNESRFNNMPKEEEEELQAQQKEEKIKSKNQKLNAEENFGNSEEAVEEAVELVVHQKMTKTKKKSKLLNVSTKRELSAESLIANQIEDNVGDLLSGIERHLDKPEAQSQVFKIKRKRNKTQQIIEKTKKVKKEELPLKSKLLDDRGDWKEALVELGEETLRSKKDTELVKSQASVECKQEKRKPNERESGQNCKEENDADQNQWQEIFIEKSEETSDSEKNSKPSSSSEESSDEKSESKFRRNSRSKGRSSLESRTSIVEDENLGGSAIKEETGNFFETKENEDKARRRCCESKSTDDSDEELLSNRESKFEKERRNTSERAVMKTEQDLEICRIKSEKEHNSDNEQKVLLSNGPIEGLEIEAEDFEGKRLVREKDSELAELEFNPLKFKKLKKKKQKCIKENLVEQSVSNKTTYNIEMFMSSEKKKNTGEKDENILESEQRKTDENFKKCSDKPPKLKKKVKKKTGEEKSAATDSPESIVYYKKIDQTPLKAIVSKEEIEDCVVDYETPKHAKKRKKISLSKDDQALLQVNKKNGGVYSLVYESTEEDDLNVSSSNMTSLVDGCSFSEIIRKFKIKQQSPISRDNSKTVTEGLSMECDEERERLSIHNTEKNKKEKERKKKPKEANCVLASHEEKSSLESIAPEYRNNSINEIDKSTSVFEKEKLREGERKAKSKEEKRKSRKPKQDNRQLNVNSSGLDNFEITTDNGDRRVDDNSDSQPYETKVDYQDFAELQAEILRKEMRRRGIEDFSMKKKKNGSKLKRKHSESETTPKQNTSSHSPSPEKKPKKLKKRKNKKALTLSEDYIPLEVPGPTKFAVAPLNKVKPYQKHSASNFKVQMLFGNNVKRFNSSSELGVLKMKQKSRVGKS